MTNLAPILGGKLVLLVVIGGLTFGRGWAEGHPNVLRPEPIRFPAAGNGTHPHVGTVLSATPMSWRDDGARPCSGPACLAAPTAGHRASTAVLVPVDDDWRQYLSKMTALLHRRRTAAATTLDPYQVSLNPAVYLNFIGDESQDRVVAGFGQENYARLAAIKARYDPDNVFHHNYNLPPQRADPAGGSPANGGSTSVTQLP